ncbi:MAG: hypothetical protein Q9187_003138 [Circinaria calcarea]
MEFHTFPRITDFSFSSSLPLPANYTRELDPSGRPYYINHTDNTTSWYHPSASRPKQDPRLPSHIKRRVDVRGRSYYLNHETKESSWPNPLKIDMVRARGPGMGTEMERTEDGIEDYLVDYETGRVTVPRVTGIVWDDEKAGEEDGKGC